MTVRLDRRSPQSYWLLAVSSLLIAGVGIYQVSHSGGWSRRPYQYQFDRPERGKITQDLNREIGFYQQRLQYDSEGGLNRALLAQSYLKMARATGETSWYLLAEQTAQESLANLSFENDGAVLALARVALAKHDFPEAIKIAQQAQDRSGALPILVAANLATGNLSVAHQQADVLVGQTPNLGSLTLRALVKLAQGQDQSAIADFQQAIALEEAGETGGSVYARTLLGRLYFKRGELQDAEQLYRESLRILPEYAPALLNLAELQVRQGHYQDAEQTYSQFFFTTRKTPTVYDHVALRGIARVKRLEGKFQEAEQWRDRAETRLRQEMSTFGHRRELAQLLLERGRSQDAPEALTLMKAESKVRRDAETLSTLAKVLERVGRSSEAATVMRTALSSGIRDAGLFHQMGLIEQQLGHSEQTQAFFEKAKQVDPTFDQKAQQALGLGVGLLGLN